MSRARQGLPAWLAGGVAGVGVFCLALAGTMYKGLTQTACLLNISFLLAVMAWSVFTVSAIVLWSGRRRAAQRPSVFRRGG